MNKHCINSAAPSADHSPPTAAGSYWSPFTFPAVLPATFPFPSPRSWRPVSVIKITRRNYKHIARDQTPASRSPTAQLCASSEGVAVFVAQPPPTCPRHLSPSPVSPPDGDCSKEKPLAGGRCPTKPAPFPSSPAPRRSRPPETQVPPSTPTFYFMRHRNFLA